MEVKTTIKFTRGYDVYVKNDIAGFDRQQAQRYVDIGVAVFFPADPADVSVMESGVMPPLPKQEKIANLCAICGAIFDTPDELTEHRKEHGL